MATFCLIPKQADAFIQKIRSGELDPAKLADLSSEERRAAFDFLGEANAKQVNQLFESKLLLKNQEAGMINWVKQLTGLKPEVQKDLLSKINKMDQLLTPKSQQTFLEDLVAHKLGATVSLSEAAKIAELAKTTTETRTAVQESSPIGSNDRMAYGRAQVAFQDYVSDLKNQTKKLTFQDFKKTPFRATGKLLSNTAGLMKSLKATLDNSAIGRQGLKVMFADPKIWAKNSLKSFKDIIQTLGGKDALNEVRAEVLSRPNAMNGLYKKEGLAVGTQEEAFPSTFPEKIPGAGRVFKAAETAFTAFQYRTRADIFDKYIDIAQKTGVDDFEGIGKVSNSLTGRGTFGPKGESAANVANNFMFSPRLLKSHIDLLTAHGFDSGISKFARQQAAYNLIKVIGGIATILTVANAVKPGSAETDTRSADAGKIKVGDTRFDYTGGMGSLVTLGTRLAPLLFGQKSFTKSSTSGKLTQINAKDKKGQPLYGAQTGLDIFFDFLTNKASPIASLVVNQLRDQNFDGSDVTPKSQADAAFTPLPITTWQELQKDPDSANKIAAMLADALGFGTNTYAPKKKGK